MTGTHFNRQATTRLELVGRDTYVFPVNDGIMSAQNSAGEALAYYRQHGSGGINLDPRKQVEVVVNSIGSSSPGFNIVVATSTLFLSRFYEVPV
jgi:hypothetical protein